MVVGYALVALHRPTRYSLVAESGVQRQKVNPREAQREHGLQVLAVTQIIELLNLLACTHNSLARVDVSSRCNSSSTIRAVQSQQMTQTDNQKNDQRSLRTPSTSDLSLVLRVKKPIDATSMADVFPRVGLIPCELTRIRDEAARIEETPRIMWHTLTKRFGTRWKIEWQECDKIPRYTGGTKKFLFAHLLAQPYIPTAPGSPGLILRPPAWTAQDDDHTFQVFSSMHDGDNLQYCGEYTTVSNVHIELKWADLPAKVRKDIEHIGIGH
jgi:hypothetical protein